MSPSARPRRFALEDYPGFGPDEGDDGGCWLGPDLALSTGHFFARNGQSRAAAPKAAIRL